MDFQTPAKAFQLSFSLSAFLIRVCRQVCRVCTAGAITSTRICLLQDGYAQTRLSVMSIVWIEIRRLHCSCCVISPCRVLDIRPMTSKIPNVTFIQCDLMSLLPDSLRNYCDSLSCLQRIRAFWFRQYGTQSCLTATYLGLNNLHNMLKSGW